MFSVNASLVAAITRELDLCALRHQVYSSNIANAQTPDYKRLEVSYQSSNANIGELQGSPRSSAIISTSEKIKLDQELAHLSRNALRYEALLTSYEQLSGIVSTAIRDGRGV